jgi:RloB-like protein
VAAPRRKLRTEHRRKSFLVLVEGEVTEEAYLLFWKRRLREKTLVDIHDFHGTPMSLVEQAVAIKEFEEKEDRRGRGRMHDEYWCVFDVDAHPYLQEAMDLARNKGVHTAISNPCIELWFLLHFHAQTAYIERHEVVRLVKVETGAGKGLTSGALDDLGEKFNVARGRAIQLEEKHRGDGTPAPGNPSSGVWNLIDAMMGG